MTFSPLIDQLILSLRCLPGVGPKTAQRMAFHLLSRHREQATLLAQSLVHAVEQVGFCQQCRTFSEHNLCRFCSDTHRDASVLCVVESPIDILAMEQTGAYRGRYFVLMGHLSPLDGIGPEDIGLKYLLEHIQLHEIKEIILATNPTVEGQATAHYIAELVKPYHIKTTRIAYGVPLGGELEFVDSGTLARAVRYRELLKEVD